MHDFGYVRVYIYYFYHQGCSTTTTKAEANTTLQPHGSWTFRVRNVHLRALDATDCCGSWASDCAHGVGWQLPSTGKRLGLGLNPLEASLLVVLFGRGVLRRAWRVVAIQIVLLLLLLLLLLRIIRTTDRLVSFFLEDDLGFGAVHVCIGLHDT